MFQFHHMFAYVKEYLLTQKIEQEYIQAHLLILIFLTSLEYMNLSSVQ